MPDFPRVQSKGVLTTQQPSVQAASDTSGQVLDLAAKAGGQVQDAAVKWSNAVDTIQKTTSQANFETGMADITARAQADPNYNNSDQYFKEIEKLKTDNLKGFSSKTAETEMGIEFGYKAKVGQIQIQNLYRKKMIDVGQASTLSLIDNETNHPTESSLQNIKNLLYGIGGTTEKPMPGSQVGSGIFDHKDAYILERKANEDLGVNRINQDLYQARTPEEVDAVTQKITSGGYEKGGVTIEPDKKKSLLDIADRARTNTEKKLQAQQEEAMSQNRVDTVVSLASGQPFESFNMKDIAEYDPQLAGTMTKVKDFAVNYNPKLTPKEQSLASAGLMSTQQVMNMKAYARSITDVFMQDDNKKLSDFLLRELDKKGDGLTSSVKIAAFVNLASLKAKANNPQDPQSEASSARFTSIKNAIQFLQASNPYLFPKMVSDFLVKSFLNGSSSPKEDMDTAKSVLRDKAIDYNKSLAKVPSLPNKIVDGEASVEDLSAGENDLKDGQNGSYADQNSD